MQNGLRDAAEVMQGSLDVVEPDDDWGAEDNTLDPDAQRVSGSAVPETTANAPRFRDGKMLMTPAARERVWKELTTIQNWLVARHDVQSMDRLSNQAQREALQRKRSEYEARSEFLTRVLAESTADADYAGGGWVTPGCVLELRFAGEPNPERYVISLIDLGDGATATSPFSPLGRALENTEIGDTVEYPTPQGDISATVVGILG